MKINQRLFDHYGIDTKKDLNIGRTCPRPFDTILIDKKGSCYACECQSWLPQSLGNLQIQGLDEIVSSRMRGHLQSSVEDGTYRYCNEHQCSYIKSGGVLHGRTTHLAHLRLAIDDSCNLRCPSCRKDMIFHKEGPAYELGIRLADKINEWLLNYEQPIQVHIGSDGDPFASHVYRHFMARTPAKPNFTYSILTNGLMFKEFHDKVPHVIGQMQELGVSIDGATKETYQRLRLGGRWEKINECLETMAELKQKIGFRFIMHFVVQKDNYHEMQQMIDLGEKYGADRVWLNKIEDWGTTDNFKEQDIWHTPEYRSQLDRVVDRIRARGNDRFIECPTLVSEVARHRNKN
jgi:MoaA/NifB/PqqE/SkfB family radical SAM enzyme